MSSKIHAGLELLSALSATELKPIEIRDLLYKLITKDYNIIDEILETAQKEKLLQRAEKTYLLTPDALGLQFEKPRIIKQEERGACKLCGKSISTGYYVVFMSRTYGLVCHRASRRYIWGVCCEKKAAGIENLFLRFKRVYFLTI